MAQPFINILAILISTLISVSYQIPETMTDQETRITNITPYFTSVQVPCHFALVSAIIQISTVFSTVKLDLRSFDCWTKWASQYSKDFKFVAGNINPHKGNRINILLDATPQYINSSYNLSLDDFKNKFNLNQSLVTGVIFPEQNKHAENCSSPVYMKSLEAHFKRFHVGFLVLEKYVKNYIRTKDFPHFYKSVCLFAKRPETFLVLEYKIDFATSDSSKTLNELDIILKLKNEILGQTQEKEIILLVTILPTKDVYINDSFGIYCDPNLEKMDVIFKAVVYWGESTKFKMIMKQVVDFEAFKISGPFWLRALEPLAHSHSTKFVFFSLQNLNILGKSQGEKCIERTSSVPDSGISFNESNIGVSINLRGVKDLSRFKQMMGVTTNKFSKLEIIAPDKTQQLKSYINISAEELQPSNATLKRIDFSIKDKTQSWFKYRGYFKDVVAAQSKNKGNNSVHISQWEAYKSDPELKQHLSDFKAFALAQSFKFGLAVENCTKEVEDIIIWENHTYFDNVSYIICNTETIQASNKDKMQTSSYLDSHLITNKLFQKQIPPLEVIFRLNLLLPNDSGKLGMNEAYLKFLNDVNSFSKTYKIQYYINAFDIPSDKQMGWWRIEDLKNLTGTSVFVERQAEYFGLHSRASHTKYIGIIAGVIAFLVIVIVTITGFILRQMQKRGKLLTKHEVQVFYSGDKQCSLMGYDAMEFVKEFEISKAEFKFDVKDVIESGKYTTTYKDYVRDCLVAVKVQKVEGEKELFLDMLTEAKMLCTVGRHANIVMFVGTHTLEIKKGILYIVTELCEMGSLMVYLKQQKEIVKAQTNQVDFLELLKFSAEISSGMEYIALQDILHGDLCTSNVFLTKEKICKIGNFGLSRKIIENNYINKGQDQLLWRWMAYESLMHGEFTTMSDVWSYGVTLWEIFTLGDEPYFCINSSAEIEDNLKTGMRLERPIHSDDKIYEILQACWNIEPALRPKFEWLTKSLENIQVQWVS